MLSTSLLCGVISVSTLSGFPSLPSVLSHTPAIRITYAGRIGIVAAGLVIARRISKIATGTTVSSTRSDKRRIIITDLAIGLSFPLAQFIICEYRCDTRHPHTLITRITQTGLFRVTDLTSSRVSDVCLRFPLPMSTLVCTSHGQSPWVLSLEPIAVSIQLILLTSMSADGFIGITLRAFLKRRKQFSELLQSNSSLTFNRYFRLMAMAGLEILCTVPLALYNVISTITAAPIYPWKGLADLHLNFGRVRQYPVEVWTTQFAAFKSGQEATEWMVIGCALVFFLIFGMAEEARKHYRLAYTSVAKRVGLSTGSLETTAGFSTYVFIILLLGTCHLPRDVIADPRVSPPADSAKLQSQPLCSAIPPSATPSVLSPIVSPLPSPLAISISTTRRLLRTPHRMFQAVRARACQLPLTRRPAHPS